MLWWEVDFNYWIIRTLAMVGLAKDVKLMGSKTARNAKPASQRVSAEPWSIPVPIPVPVPLKPSRT
jgi:hypothetical protein